MYDPTRAGSKRPWRIEELTLSLYLRAVEKIRAVIDSPWLPHLQKVWLVDGSVCEALGPVFTRRDGKMVQLG